MSTAFIIDPPLRSSAGHHRALAFGWAAAAHENGYDALILGNEDWTSESLDGFEVERVFKGDYYGVATGRHVPLASQLSQRQTAFRDSLTKPLRGIRRHDMLVLAFPTAYTMNGVAAWAAGLPEERRPRLVVWLLMGPADDEFAAAIGSTDIVITAYDRLRGLFGDRVSFLASTEAIAADCRLLGAGDFPVVPFVALRPPLMARAASAAQAKVPLLGVLGDIHAAKGSGHIAGIVDAIDRQGLACRWLVAGSAKHADPRDHADLHRLTEREDGLLRLDLQPGGLENFDSTLSSLDLVVLPYSPDHYATRGSGIAEEAALIGVPIVAPAVIAKDRPGAIAFDDWTTQAISSAVAEAINRLPELTEAARIAARSVASTLRRDRVAMLERVFPTPPPEPALVHAPTSDLPLVEVVVTLHNYRRFIRHCLDSVARQSYPNWRCIVVDDASDDLSFAEGRALVASLGPRFSYERHAKAEGQLQAIATGASLGSGTFVALLDADDYLADNALDHHIAWHLNSLDPVALTSGGLAVVDSEGTRVAGALDNNLWRHQESGLRLTGDKAFTRQGSPIIPEQAKLFDQTQGRPGSWYWNPTSTMMLRRAVLELIMPEDGRKMGRYAADTYLGLVGHAVGGSLCFSAVVAFYRRHGDNGYSDAPVMGTATLPVRDTSSNWATVAVVFGGHLRARLPLFQWNIARYHIDRLLALSEAAAPGSTVHIVTGTPAADAMRYPKLLSYAAGRLWRGTTRRLLLRAPTAGIEGADQLSIRDLASYVMKRTRRGIDRRFLR